MWKLWRSILVTTVATAAAGAAWMFLTRWSERALQVGESRARLPDARSREDHVDQLSEDQKQQLLDELGRHV